uniref:Uncharacterized protein n=1 Tax=Ditylenchus dipsaci TaxID=166011 RepID=A0A915D1Y6_9BILA
MSCDPLKNVSLVLVYPQISSNGSHPTSVRPYESMFRNLLPRVAQCVEKVDLTMNAADLVSIETCTLQCLNIIQKRVREIVKRRPNDHIFLAGWGTSCLLNHKVVSLVPGVSGLLNFAFPVDSATGPRGDVEDEICLTYCPSLFVVGENAADVNFEALQNMRKNIIVDSGLIVVGAANHNLFVSQLRLNIERISQKCVERTIVEHTVDFMKQVMSDLGPQSSKECREMLKPVTLQNIYDVDITALRCRPNPPIAGVPRPRKNASNSQTGLKQSLVKAFDAKPHNKPSSNLKSLHVQSVCSTSSTFHAPQQPSPLSLQSYGPITSSKEGHHPLSTHNSGFGVPSPPAARPAPLLSARTSLNSSLKKVSGDPLRIPTPLCSTCNYPLQCPLKPPCGMSSRNS